MFDMYIKHYGYMKNTLILNIQLYWQKETIKYTWVVVSLHAVSKGVILVEKPIEG